MAAPTNDTNQVWNDLHYGNRCPINDTEAEGAPVALGSHDSSWARGSVNRAVRNTWLIGGNDFSIDDMDEAEAGKLSLANVGAYIYRDMAYGFKGDAVNQQPGDMMCYRAYPSAITKAAITFGSLESNSLILRLGITNTRRVMYDVAYTVVFEGVTYELMIRGTDKTVSLYRIQGNTDWISLPYGYLFVELPKPTVETTYQATVTPLFPEQLYPDITNPISYTVTSSMLVASCTPAEWTFKRPIRVGGVDIEEMYENPTTAQRIVTDLRIPATIGRLGQKTADLDINGDFQIGYIMATGESIQSGDCMTDFFTGENITHQYLWSGTLIPTTVSDGDYAGDGQSWLVDTIYKLGDDDILEGIAFPVGFPVIDTTP